MGKLISTQEIVKKYNIPYSTVNHYTVIGLFVVTSRKKNVRLYDDTEVEKRLEKTVELRSKGYSLQLIVRELSKSGKW